MLPVSNKTSTLLESAERYIEHGYSVIPVIGDADPDRSKVAAVAWSEFQKRQPTEDELRHWFIEQHYQGLAIVTGTVSGLVILDFDTSVAFIRFCDKLPGLIDTYTVKSRRGHHLYYRLPAGLTLPSRKRTGIDLLSDGKYVVAPPTTITGWTYRVCRHTELYSLSEGDIAGILAFFGPVPAPTPEVPPAIEYTPYIRISEPVETRSPRPLTKYDLISRYKYRTDREGRNEALFWVSVQARDNGWSLEDVLACLVEPHVNQPAGKSHQHETAEQRRREAIASIYSAFSRPARPCKRRDQYNNAQLPNSVREALLHTKMTCVVRVIEGLRLTGIEPGQSFTIGQALQKLKGRVGRDSIYQALSATISSGQRVFETLPPAPPTPATADKQHETTHNKQCFVVTPQKPGKNQRGRPAQVFVMPGNLDLCRKLDVKPSLSDPLTLDDVETAKKTCQAVHREFIRRRPGQYPCRWLAQRLGICTRTLQAYNREIPINVQPMYFEMPVTWSTLAHIPDGFELGGTFLVDETGKRYPARREIAMRLLSKKRCVTYKRRTMNYYWYGNNPPDRAIRLGLRPAAPVIEAKRKQLNVHIQQHEDRALGSRVESSRQKMEPKAGDLPQIDISSVRRSQTSTSELSVISGSKKTGKTEHQSQPAKPTKRRYRKPLLNPQMEHLAQKIHTATNPTGPHTIKGMSLCNARRLVELYGIGPVEQAWRTMVRMQQRGKISNPAGFLVVASRIAWRVAHHATDLGMPAPRFRGEPPRSPRRVTQ